MLRIVERHRLIVELHDNLSFAPSITLRPDGPVEMTVRRRD
ncbi:MULTISPECIES: hypothetical protein [Halomicrobium]|nr:MULTISPECIES: hypothetical protein [Halomicrobium]